MLDVQAGGPKMTAKKRSLRKVFWVEVIVLLIVAIPVVAWAGAIAANVAPVWNGLSFTEPTALALLGGGLISASFVIRRFKS